MTQKNGAAHGRPTEPDSRAPVRRSKGIKTQRLMRQIAAAGPELKSRERAILFALALHIRWTETKATEKAPRRPPGVAWPGVPTIAREAGCSLNTAEAGLVKLRRLRWLEIEPCYFGGRRTSSSYRVTPPEHGAPSCARSVVSPAARSSSPRATIPAAPSATVEGSAA